jgi:hypothetical protein
MLWLWNNKIYISSFILSQLSLGSGHCPSAIIFSSSVPWLSFSNFVTRLKSTKCITKIIHCGDSHLLRWIVKQCYLVKILWLCLDAMWCRQWKPVAWIQSCFATYSVCDLDFSKSQFPHLLDGGENCAYHRKRLWGFRAWAHLKHSNTMSGTC